MDDVLARLAALEDERSILRTLYGYGHTIDVGDEEGWVELFAADAVFTVHAREEDYPPFRIAGRADLLDFVRNHTRPPELWHKHLLIEPLIDLDGDEAGCTSYFVVLVEHEGAPTVRVFGRYVDHLARGADGRWRFAERVAHLESLTPGLPPLAWGRPGATRPD